MRFLLQTEEKFLRLLLGAAFNRGWLPLWEVRQAKLSILLQVLFKYLEFMIFISSFKNILSVTNNEYMYRM